MSTSKFCDQCSSPLNPDAIFCPQCGVKIKNKEIPHESAQPNQAHTAHQAKPSKPKQMHSTKSGGTALALCIILGMLGAHRFYVGRFKTGFLMLISLGFAGLWVIADLALIARNKFTDKKRKPLLFKKYDTALQEKLTVFGAIAAWFISIMLILTVLYGYKTSGLIDVVNNELSALSRGDVSTAYSYTSQNYKRIISLDYFKKFIQQYPILVNNEGASSFSRALYGNMGYVSATLNAKDGTNTPVRFQLIKENDEWRILNIEVFSDTNPK